LNTPEPPPDAHSLNRPAQAQAAGKEPEKPSPGHGSVYMLTPIAPPFQEIKATRPFTAPANLNTDAVGTGVLHDHTNRELQLDGTPKQTYRHPNFGHNKNPRYAQQQRIEQAAQANQQHQGYQQDLQDDDLSECGHKKNNIRDRAIQPLEMRKLNPVVKPAKLNIPEFEGTPGSKLLNNTLIPLGQPWINEPKWLSLTSKDQQYSGGEELVFQLQPYLGIDFVVTYQIDSLRHPFVTMLRISTC
jgi:hypothetical protein